VSHLTFFPVVDRDTVDVYERRAQAWLAQKRRPIPASLAAFAARVPAGTIPMDLGCGPGWHTLALGPGAIAVDAAHAMLDLVAQYAPGAARVAADLEALPFRRGALGGTWAHKCYMHVPADRVPLALADLHRALQVGGALHVHLTSDRAAPAEPDERFAGRHFDGWSLDRLIDVVIGAGFSIEHTFDDGQEWLDVEATRARTLADTVGPGMRVLIVGLNPSEYSADAGHGFARPGNRFWPAALEAGIVTRAHDPVRALRVDGIGMTDLVKRATRRADELTREEFVSGAGRLERLTAWLKPGAICFVGLSGYRAAVDRQARSGWQAEPFGGRPVYVMPNTSGVNGHATPAELAAHLRQAATTSGPSREL
jgi:double-stranded uracil-DNA glycosylase